MQPLPETDAIPIFEKTQHELISLLKSLSTDEWEYSTSSSTWNVKDVIAHLLDGDLRRLSLHRDNHKMQDPSDPINSYESLVDYLNDLNNTWVRASKRLSPRLLIELTEFTTPKVIQHLKGLDPKDPALFSVGWAGEAESENWFDIAREYTEKWHHQQQVREATGRPLLVGEQWLSPLLNTLIRGVPPVYDKYADKNADEQIEIYITGVIDNSWILTTENNRWQLYESNGDEAKTTIELDDDTAWRVFTKNITEQEALKRIKIAGNQKLGQLISKTVSYMK
ncbi:Mycothiol maleylpyruvate isomerase N-terminal domain-containing protein [Fodinibius roseus]|uniref:Mycothiol maleylpyruvate isomerase N-terminal domain-containing protein n=1 Tax=Fodinibius roseus TaxID=1194090 RepID=A0A1M5GHM3_9BACT|nr:maleylpyruvate isomerase N-terminal domain-containing protein [Fodinibius roseus]SHG03186.1 Mycothiol maleylpyruvate isomerase N-terminal domain-containing protein [Fodinibius roseus]